MPLLDRHDPLLRDHLAHDLADGRVRLDPDVLVADAVDTLLGTSPWRQLERPTRLVHAEWSVGAGSARRTPPSASRGSPRNCPRSGTPSWSRASTTPRA